MAIRVTQVVLQVLHSGKQALDGTVGVSQYKHNYTALDMSFDATYDVEIGVAVGGIISSSAWDLAGFTQLDGVSFNSGYDVSAYAEFDSTPFSSTYALDVWVPIDGVSTHAYTLNAYIVQDGRHYGNYALNAYEASETVFNSEYELQVYLLAQGYMDGLYGVDVYLQLQMQAISAYDYLTYEQNDNVIANSTYDLNAWEARENAVGAHYALLTFLQANAYLDSTSTLEVFQALEEKYGVHYDLNTFQLLQKFSNHSYDIEVLKLAELRFGAHYELDIYSAFDGFVDSTAVLNAYQQADGFTDGRYGISVYVSNTGFVDAEYAILALQQATGSLDSLYLLDTFQELFTWVVNYNTGTPARYEGYDFDAFAVIGQDYLAARGDGIYLLDGDDDNGTEIDAIATIGRTDFSAFYDRGEGSLMKRVTAAYLGLNSEGQAHLTLRTDQGITSGPYRLRQRAAASTTERAKFKRGIKSRYWEFDIENVDGEDLQVKSAEFETVVLGGKRRLKK